MKIVNIGLVGFGTVGRGVYHLIRDNATVIHERTGLDLKLRRICDLDLSRVRGETGNIPVTDRWEDVVNDPEIDVVIELIGGIEPAQTIQMSALAAGKDVVTANKKLLAEQGTAIFSLAAQKNLSVGFEAAVGGGIPCILTLQSGLVANRIRSIMGILNGTTNYILTRMSEDGMPFDQALQDAQKKGFAEADPTFDIEGFDAGHKTAILAMLGFNTRIDYKTIPIEGITRLSQIDISYAQDMGYLIKLLGIAKKVDDKIDISVRPTMIAKHHPLAMVRDENNAVMYDCDMTGPVILYGKGAGSLPTASAVASDIVRIAESKGMMRSHIAGSARMEYLAPHQRESRYYLRMYTQDSPGILSRITGVLGQHNISIASVLQKEVGEKNVPLILMTHEAGEESVLTAKREIESFDFISGDVMMIRIEDTAF